jgi:sugar O-acyltransferase (sialic acid O-acetyltransferase NeuD family)
VGRSLFIIRAGGHGRVVADVAELLGYTDIRFLDDAWPAKTSTLDWPVVGCDLPAPDQNLEVFVGNGVNGERLSEVNALLAKGYILPTLIHPKAYVSSRARIGAGSMVAAMAVVGVGATLGQAVIINTGATVDHDCVLGDGVHVSPGGHLAGTVHVGDESWIGIGAAVREGIRIGARVMVGAGAVVVSDIADGLKVMGNPARVKT